MLNNAQVANDTVVLFGDVKGGDSANRLMWGIGVTESTETPTQRETPTQTATDSSSPTSTTAAAAPRQTSSTTKPSPTDVPNSAEREIECVGMRVDETPVVLNLTDHELLAPDRSLDLV